MKEILHVTSDEYCAHIGIFFFLRCILMCETYSPWIKETFHSICYYKVRFPDTHAAILTKKRIVQGHLRGKSIMSLCILHSGLVLALIYAAVLLVRHTLACCVCKSCLLSLSIFVSRSFLKLSDRRQSKLVRRRRKGTRLQKNKNKNKREGEGRWQQNKRDCTSRRCVQEQRCTELEVEVQGVRSLNIFTLIFYSILIARQRHTLWQREKLAAVSKYEHKMQKRQMSFVEQV